MVCIYDCKTGLCKEHGLSKAVEDAIAAKAKSDAEWAAMIADEQRRRAEDDKTDINVVPIDVPGEQKLEVLGLYFNESEITKDEEPAQELVIPKDVLDRSSGFILGRFKFEIPARSKIVFEVFVDGIKIDDFGTNLPYMESSGVYDTTLFEWPGSNKANRDGNHRVEIKAGLITGIVEKELGMVVWGKVKAVTHAVFNVKLLKHEIVD